MNYIGSKNKLLPFITEVINGNIKEDLNHLIFCDLFAGTGVIGTNYNNKVNKVISNDLEYYSYILNYSYLKTSYISDDIIYYISMLNSLDGQEGFIYKNYCEGSGSNRNYFYNENLKKIYDIIKKINELFINNKINEMEFYFLLTLLIEASDKVSNTASVYGSFLKSLKKTAKGNLQLSISNKFKLSSYNNDVYNMQSNQLIKLIKGDILYLDPPYNHRQYGSNYHLLNTIAKYDNFVPKGKTGIRDYIKSDYCYKTKATESFVDLMHNANFKYIFLSYNNEGIIPINIIEETMSSLGKYSRIEKQYLRFKSDKDENRTFKSETTIEYIHFLQKK